jgi:hypothetical protein
VAVFRITVACDSDDELQGLPDEPLRRLYEAIAENEEGATLTDSIGPGGVQGFIRIELAAEHQGAVEQLLARVCLRAADLSPSWFEVVSA